MHPPSGSVLLGGNAFQWDAPFGTFSLCDLLCSSKTKAPSPYVSFRAVDIDLIIWSCRVGGGPLASVHRDIWGLSLFLLPTLISSWLPLRRICHCDPPTSSFPPPLYYLERSSFSQSPFSRLGVPRASSRECSRALSRTERSPRLLLISDSLRPS